MVLVNADGVSAWSVQHLFVTQQGLNQELTLDLLEKFRHPEKLKTSLATDDEEMEVNYIDTHMGIYTQMGMDMEMDLNIYKNVDVDVNIYKNVDMDVNIYI